MRFRVTKNQIELIKTSFQSIKSQDDILLEQKLFKVNLWLGVYKTQIVVFSDNSASARVVAKKLFPNAKVFSAEPISGKIC